MSCATSHALRIVERPDGKKAGDVLAVHPDGTPGSPLVQRQGAQRVSRGWQRDRRPDHEQAQQRVERIACPGRPDQRRQLAPRGVREGVLAEPLGQGAEREAGRVERLARPPDCVAPVEEAHRPV